MEMGRVTIFWKGLALVLTFEVMTCSDGRCMKSA